MINLTKPSIMKIKSYLFLVAFLGAVLFVSCTPENIEDESTEQQIIRPDIPQNG